MIGFIPKSAIIRFVREDWFVTKTVYTPDEIKKQIKQCRTNMMYNFAKTHNTDRRGDINDYNVEDANALDDGPQTRSMAQPVDDWLVDTSAADVIVGDYNYIQLNN